MPFVNGLWRTDPIVSPETEEFVVTKNNITISLYNSMPYKNEYKFNFMINIMAPTLVGKKVDPVKLRKAFLDKIGADAEYFFLDSIQNGKAVMIFNTEKWLNDAFKGMKTSSDYASFTKNFSFSKQLPSIIRTDINRHFFISFFVRRFREYLAKKDSQKNFLTSFIPSIILEKMKGLIEHVFEYDYDFQYNKFSIKIKPEVVASFIVGAAALMDKKKDYRPNIDFEKSVQKEIKNYEKNKVKALF